MRLQLPTVLCRKCEITTIRPGRRILPQCQLLALVSCVLQQAMLHTESVPYQHLLVFSLLPGAVSDVRATGCFIRIVVSEFCTLTVFRHQISTSGVPPELAGLNFACLTPRPPTVEVHPLNRAHVATREWHCIDLIELNGCCILAANTLHGGQPMQGVSIHASTDTSTQTIEKDIHQVRCVIISGQYEDKCCSIGSCRRI